MLQQLCQYWNIADKIRHDVYNLNSAEYKMNCRVLLKPRLTYTVKVNLENWNLNYTSNYTT
jgi:hypothetical protein